jgi:glycosyltransferase involved in cell wall biosynthesis
MGKSKIKILFLIGSLSAGGKERRLLELLTYLGSKDQYELYLLTKKTASHFDNFSELNVVWIQMSGSKIGIYSFWEFFRIAKKINPDFVHTWGSIQTLITLPFMVLNKNTKLINSQITSAPPKIKINDKIISKINFFFSDIILANSKAGIASFNPPAFKSRIIYNGLNLLRFQNLNSISEIKKKFDLDKKFTIIMVAAYSPNKDFIRFFEVGIALKKIGDDIKFIGIGFFKGGGEVMFEACKELTKDFPDLIPIEGTSNVESLVNACDIGMLFSPNGEGLSNSILEYMALGKPVIANNAGGTKEIVENGINGYLVYDESPEEIATLINDLLNNHDLMKNMGNRSRQKIVTDFSLDRMGKEFEKVYQNL